MPRHTKSRTPRAQRWLILLMIGALIIAPWPGPAAPAPAVRAQTGTTQAANQDYDGPAGPPYVLPGWGDVPWAARQYYTTIQLGDLDGDGKDELIGRDVGGIAVHKFDSALGQWLPVLAADGTILRGPLSDTDGWDFPQYYLTIQLADVDGKPGKELIARGAGGINVLQFTNETKPGANSRWGSGRRSPTAAPSQMMMDGKTKPHTRRSN